MIRNLTINHLRQRSAPRVSGDDPEKHNPPRKFRNVLPA